MKEFSKELKEAERFGQTAVRVTCESAMQEGNQDYEWLMGLANTFLQAADRAHCRKDDEMVGTYLVLYHELCDFAREHLNREQYHRFCENQEDRCIYLYL